MKWLLLLLMLAPGTGFGQKRPAPPKGTPARQSAPAPAPAKWPIDRLVVEGNRHYTREQILAVAGLKVGQVVGKEEFDAARDRLVASGFFEMVGYRFEPAPGKEAEVATFEVTEIDAVWPARFEELGVPAPELESMLRARDPLFSPSIPPTKPVLDRYVNWIQEYLAGKGSTEKVAALLNPVGQEKFEIVFRPARNLPNVAQVSFEGNQAVSQNLLRDAIAGVAVGTPYTEERFRELLNTAVRPVYEARGRVRVSFPKVRAEPASDVQGLHVTVTVQEGDSYGLRKVEIAGPAPLKPADLLKAANIPPADVINFDQVNEGIERMRKALSRAGFMEAKVSPVRSIDDANKKVDLALRVDSGPQFLMGKLTIAGLDLNAEHEIRRIWNMKEGKPFDADYPQMFLNSVREQGLFDNLGETKSAVQINNQDHTADVTLTFAGAGPQKPAGRGRFGDRP